MAIECVNPQNSRNVATNEFTVTYRNDQCNPVINNNSLDIPNVYLEWGASPITRTFNGFSVSSDCEGVEY
jgi:hypothetical protein